MALRDVKKQGLAPVSSLDPQNTHYLKRAVSGCPALLGAICRRDLFTTVYIIFQLKTLNGLRPLSLTPPRRPCRVYRELPFHASTTLAFPPLRLSTEPRRAVLLSGPLFLASPGSLVLIF